MLIIIPQLLGSIVLLFCGFWSKLTCTKRGNIYNNGSCSVLATLILIHWFYQPYYNWKYSKYIGFVNWVNFTYCVSFCRIFMQRVSISSILLFTTFRFIHGLVPWQCPEGILFLKSPLRAILYDRKKTHSTDIAMLCLTITLDILFANTGYTTGWKVPCLDSQQHTEQTPNLAGSSSRCKCLRLRQQLSREFPAAKQSELSYADWLNCRDRGWILVHPEKTWSGQDFVRPLAKGEKPLGSLHWNPTKTPKN